MHPDLAGPQAVRATGRRGRGRLSVVEAQELDAQLLASAQAAFVAHGYGATSMAALARAAGVSKTTLYAKHPSKAALFRAVTERQSAEAYALVRSTAGARAHTLAGSLSHLAEQTVLTASTPQNLGLNRLLEWEAARFPELAEILQGRSRTAIAHIAGQIRRFSEIDGVPCRDPEGAASLFNFAVRGLYHDIQTGVRPARPDLVVQWIGLIVQGFLADRARW